MRGNIYKSLTKASTDVIMLGKVEHLTLSWTTSDGTVNSVFDKDNDNDASFVEMFGGLEMIKARIIDTQ